MADSGAKLSLSDESYIRAYKLMQTKSAVTESKKSALLKLPWVKVQYRKKVKRPAGDDVIARGGSPDDVVYLQYTSGSTSQPKGVMVTHRALLEYARDSHQHLFGARGQVPQMLSWAPFYHDMGLIHGCVAPIYMLEESTCWILVGCSRVMWKLTCGRLCERSPPHVAGRAAQEPPRRPVSAEQVQDRVDRHEQLCPRALLQPPGQGQAQRV